MIPSAFVRMVASLSFRTAEAPSATAKQSTGGTYGTSQRTTILLTELLFSRGVFLRISRFPVVKWQVLVPVLGRDPRQTAGNTAIRALARNTLTRPCNLYRNSRNERVAAVDMHGKHRGILQGVPKKWSPAHDLSHFS